MAGTSEQPKQWPVWAKGLVWFGFFFVTMCVWPIFVGCNRMGEIEDVSNKLESAVSSVGRYDDMIVNSSWYFVDNGTSFSRYGNYAFAEMGVSLSQEEYGQLLQELGFSESEKKGRNPLEQRTDGYWIEVSPIDKWEDTESIARSVYKISVSKEIGLLTPFEWIQTLD